MKNCKQLLASLALLGFGLPLWASDLPADLTPGRVLARASLSNLSGETRAWFGTASQSETTLELQLGQVELLQLDDGAQRVSIEGAEEILTPEQLQLPRMTWMVEVPANGSIGLEIEELATRPLPIEAFSLGEDEQSPRPGRTVIQADEEALVQLAEAGGWNETALLGEPIIFRDLRLVQLTYNPVVVREGSCELVERASLRLVYHDNTAPRLVQGNELRTRRHWSSNMEANYSAIVSNHGQFYDDVDDSVFPVYLIVGAPSYTATNVIGEFVTWKRQKGFDVRVVPFDDEAIGGTTTVDFTTLRNYINTAWDELRPEYLLLLGDDDGTTACPDSVVISEGNEFDVSDHFYSLHEGDDYVSDLFVGRFSVENPQQLYIMAQKPVAYELYPSLNGSAYLERGLAVSCNYSDNSTPPVTPNQTSHWVYDKFVANGFEADTIFYPGVSDGGGPISQWVNQGTNMISYRGWANSNGWIFPAYDRNDVAGLTNVYRLPVVASFVCQTGAFGAGGNLEVEDPCFGEVWMRIGDVGAPKGACAFVGPSDLHTKSQYNNPVCSGWFNAIFDLDITSVGPALANGKMELSRGYPREGIGDDFNDAYFYYHVYNVLGDPDMKIWRHTPYTMAVEAASTLSAGQDYLDIYLTDADSGAPLPDARVTATAGSQSSLLLARGVSQEDGHIFLEIPVDELTGAGVSSFKLTCNHLDYQVLQQQVTLSTDTGVSFGSLVVSAGGDDQVQGGEQVSLQLTLSNSGTTDLPAGTLSLRDPADWVQIPDYYTLLTGQVTTPALTAGTSAQLDAPLQLQVLGSVPAEELLPLVFDYASGSLSSFHMEQLSVQNKQLHLSEAWLHSGENHLRVGMADTLSFYLCHDSGSSLLSATAMLVSGDQLISVSDSIISLASLVEGDSLLLSYPLTPAPAYYDGRQPELTLLVSEGDSPTDFSLNLAVDVPVIDRQTSDPLGPDSYGYYAIESTDYQVLGHPAYNWYELDAYYGGEGTWIEVEDDSSAVVEIPFPIQFYGEEFDRITVCSNGWISMGETWMANFRNWNIPSSLGPPNMICAWWDDLKPVYDIAKPDSAHVPVFMRHDEAEGRFIISWSRTYCRDGWESPGQPVQEFQIVLFSQDVRPTDTGDTDILMQYKTVTNQDQANNYATVGIQNFGHNDGLEVTYSNFASEGCVIPGAGHAILFTTEAPSLFLQADVPVIQPLPQEWLTLTNAELVWNDSLMTANLGGSPTYTAVIRNSANEELYRAEGLSGSSVSISGVELPENTELFFDLHAYYMGLEFGALQGVIPFYYDGTAPTLVPALLANSLYQNYFELGLHCNEELAELQAHGLDANGQELAEFALLEGESYIGTGQRVYFLQTQLDQDLARLSLYGIDTHGLETSQEIQVIASLNRSSFELPGAEVQILGQSNAWTLALASRTDNELLLPGASWNQLDLQLASGRSFVLSMDAREGVELVRLDAAGPVFVASLASGDRITLTESGSYGLAAEGTGRITPASFELTAIVPNPFNPRTNIRFELPDEGKLRAVIHNLRGQQVCVLHDGTLPAGAHNLTWEGRNAKNLEVASGLYFVTLEYHGELRTARMLLLR